MANGSDYLPMCSPVKPPIYPPHRHTVTRSGPRSLVRDPRAIQYKFKMATASDVIKMAADAKPPFYASG